MGTSSALLITQPDDAFHRFELIAPGLQAERTPGAEMLVEEHTASFITSQHCIIQTRIQLSIVRAVVLIRLSRVKVVKLTVPVRPFVVRPALKYHLRRHPTKLG